MADATPDELFTLKNSFWLGHFQSAVNEGTALMHLSTDALKAERDFYVYRAYAAMGNYHVVLDEIKESVRHSGLLGVKLLASYLNDPSARETALVSLGEWCADTAFSTDPLFALVAGTIFLHEGDYGSCLKTLAGVSTLESMALQTQALLRMDRVDLAVKQVAAMQKADDDSTLTQLAAAWLYCAQGGDKYAEASYIYQELSEKFGSSIMLLNGLGVCNMHMRRFDVAEKHFIDASSMGNNDPDTLVNLITCFRHMGKPKEHVERYVSQLRRVAPDHPYVKDLDKVAGMFDRVAATLDVA